MKNILLLGAGLSASTLIKYLLDRCEAEDWMLHVVDQNSAQLQQKLNGHPRGIAHLFDALDSQARRPYIAQAHIVISMLPAIHHVEVAKDCIALQKNLLTPSYISSEMRALHQEALAAGIVILNEIGLDPGLDHMSAMRIIDHIKGKGGVLKSFKSFCGGLIAPASDNNPWHYKFTWNPRNVVLAGQGPAACYREMNELKYVTYQRLFQQLDTIEIENYGTFQGYANRDSLSYLSTYGIEDIPTIFRGTLRRPPFCEAWNVFVQLGMTEDHFQIHGSEKLTPRQFLNAFLPFQEGVSVEDKLLLSVAKNQQIFELFEAIGLFEDHAPIGLSNASPAQLLQHILMDKWRLHQGDKDMIVMVHQIQYQQDSKRYQIDSSLVVEGQDERYTAMANTVGLPIAIACKLIMTGQIHEKGVTLPVSAAIYEPILHELEEFGLIFNETEKLI
ncbi:MAG: saccharopine dehydrogenase family protein [Sphingomonadales bacterium]